MTDAPFARDEDHCRGTMLVRVDTVVASTARDVDGSVFSEDRLGRVSDCLDAIGVELCRS